MEIRTSRTGEHVTEGTRALWRAVKARGWSQGDLARKLGTSSANVNRWLHGDRAPSRRWAGAIETLLGVDAALWDKAARGDLVLRRTEAA